MSRGGRRRKSRKKAAPPAGRSSRARTPRADAAPDGNSNEDKTGNAAGDESVVTQMRQLPRSLQTFPQDDLILEDLIEGLQREYGVPPTPQEYRLVIRTPSAEAEESLAAGEEAEEADSREPSGTSARRRRRRRTEVPEAAKAELDD